MKRVVVLLGPPGCEKSTVGAALRERGLRFREWEQHILDRWGSREAFVVRLDLSEETALDRVARRRHGQHLSDDTEANRAIWRAVQLHVVPSRRVDLVIDTEHTPPEQAAGTVLHEIAARAQSWSATPRR